MQGLVLTAAGASTRFGAEDSKVLHDLCGRPVLCHALDAFRAAIPGLAVVITARPRDQAQIEALAGDAQVVPGGPTRQASVRRGVAALPDTVEIILVHDAARPLIRIEDIQRVLAAAKAHGAAIAAAPVTDTIHATPDPSAADGTRRLGQPLDRSQLVAAQTPQAARAALLRGALARADEAGFAGTDEASVLRFANIPVVACVLEGDNLKLTTPLDLEVAARRLARGR